MLPEEAAWPPWQLRSVPSVWSARQAVAPTKGDAGAVLVAKEPTVVVARGGVPIAGQAASAITTGAPVVAQKTKTHGDDAVHAVATDVRLGEAYALVP